MSSGQVPRNNLPAIRKVACIGAGLIGQGWAVTFALGGLEAIVYDVDQRALEEAQRKVKNYLEFLEKEDLANSTSTQEAYSRIEWTTDFAKAVNGVQYVQESVPDNLSIKREIFRKLDALTGPYVILGSSSSGFRMSDIQKGLRYPGRCVLVHPFLPVHIIPVVEIVGGELTAPEVVDQACALMELVGKVPIRLNKEVPGYILNRFQAAILREAIDLVAREVASAEDIDKAFRLGIGIRDPFMGPFIRASMAGGDIVRFFDRFSVSYHNRWKDLASWTEIPEEAKERVIEQVKQLEVGFGKSPEERELWRDSVLARMIHFLRSLAASGFSCNS